jgi:hypothetical protein
MPRALLITVAAVAILTVAASADLLSGSWSTDICHDGVSAITTLSSVLTIHYEICNWRFSAHLGFDLTGWSSVAFAAGGVLGLLTVDTKAMFDPVSSDLLQWVGETELFLASVETELDFEMLGNGDLGLGISMAGDAGPCVLGAHVSLAGNCELNFQGISFNAGFSFGCVEWVEVRTGFGCGTFEGICFDIDDLQLAGIDWLLFDLTVCFDDGEEGKTFTFIPQLDLGRYDCFTLHAELVKDPVTEFLGFDVYGVALYHSWNGMYFRSVSSLRDDKNAMLIGDPRYWEMICFGTVSDGCCGKLDFEICTYFAKGSFWLFDWERTTAQVGVEIADAVELTGSLDISDAGLERLCLGIDVRW